MIVYDRLEDGINPAGLPSGTHPSGALLIRAVYDHTGIHSWLFGWHKPDGVHLVLEGPSGRTRLEASDPKHHHISKALMSRPREYAALFGTGKFILESPRDPAFLKKRLPDWTPAGFVRDGVYRMEYVLT